MEAQAKIIKMQKSKRLHVIIDNKIPFIEGILDPCADTKSLPGKQFSAQDVKNADALLVRTRTKCDQSILENSNVKFIGSATIGYDHIDTQYCDQHNIAWTNSPGCNADSVAQYIAAALLHLEKKYNFNLKEKTLGIIGVGNVGSRVEKVAHALSMEVILNDPPRQREEGTENFSDLDFLLKKADIITMHTPLNESEIDATQHLANQTFFNKFTKPKFFINTSRGEVVEESALKKACKEGKITGVVIDVWNNEPHADQELIDLVDIATPHIAGYSNEGKANGTAMVIQALSSHFNLGLENWYPENLPQDENQLIQINEAETKEILYKAVEASYNIEKEDQRFRMIPTEFENIRGNYGLRREFPHYAVKLKQNNKEAKRILELLGFRIEGKRLK